MSVTTAVMVRLAELVLIHFIQALWVRTPAATIEVSRVLALITFADKVDSAASPVSVSPLSIARMNS